MNDFVSAANCTVKQKSCRFFVGGFDSTITEIKLLEYFSQWGEILKTEIIRKKGSGISRGYGFVTTHPETASKISAYSHCLGGRTLDLGKALNKEETNSFKKKQYQKKIFIRNLDPISTTSGKPKFNLQNS